jgi:predicted nucleic acid-binding protein
MTCVIDTNPLIYLLSGAAEPAVLRTIEEAIRHGALFSVITRIEIMGWPGHTVDSRNAAAALLDQMEAIELTRNVAGVAIEIRSRIAIKLPDAIIAASALTERLPLMTRNTADFSRIPGLALIDPFAG